MLWFLLPCLHKKRIDAVLFSLTDLPSLVVPSEISLQILSHRYFIIFPMNLICVGFNQRQAKKSSSGSLNPKLFRWFKMNLNFRRDLNKAKLGNPVGVLYMLMIPYWDAFCFCMLMTPLSGASWIILHILQQNKFYLLSAICPCRSLSLKFCFPKAF